MRYKIGLGARRNWHQLPISLGMLLWASAVSAQETPVFDVPRLSNVAVDGQLSDWDEKGFRVNALTPMSGVRSVRDFNGTIRLGWNERGLLVAVQVRDNQASEGKNPKELWQKDSVEFFWGIKQGVRDWVQVHIGPGIDPETPQLRVNVDDHRETPTLRNVAVNVEVARQKTGDGYTLEALLPWNCLGITAKDGREVSFQIVLNDVDGNSGRAQWMWFPEEGAYSDAGKLHRVRLAAKASAPVLLAAQPDYRDFPRTKLTISATSQFAGATVIASDSKGELGRTLLKAVSNEPGELTSGNLTLRRIPSGLVRLTGNYSFIPVALQNVETLRKNAFQQATLKFEDYVFDVLAFPSVDFANPERVESLIGPYTLTTEFYSAAMEKVTTPIMPGRYGAVTTVTADNGKIQQKYYTTLFRMAKELDWDTWNGDFALPLPAETGIDSTVVKEQTQSVSGYLKSLLLEDTERSPLTAVFLSGLFEAKPGEPPVNRLSVDERDRRWWYLLQKQRGEAKPYRAIVETPKDYNAQSGKKYPLLLFLHGSGERGFDLNVVRTHGPLRYIREGHDLPFIVVVPQCEPGSWWLPVRLATLLDEIQARYAVDPDRVYLTGLSMGGFGSWSLALEYPERFAAVAPICGGGDPVDANRIVKLPVWNFHGGKDSVVPVKLSQDMIDALKKAGATDVQFTIYPEAGHDSWTETYNNAKLYEWFLSHTRQK